MAGRQLRGRQKIPIRRIQSQEALFATFSKRRQGIYKKASELSTLCGVDIGVIIISKTNHLYSFWSPTDKSVIESHLHIPLDAETRLMVSEARSQIEYRNGHLDELLDEKDILKGLEKDVDEDQPQGGLENLNVNGLGEENVMEWKAWFADLKSKVTERLNDPSV